MELIKQLLMSLILINAAIKLSFWKKRQIVIMLLIYTAFILCIYPLSIKQSKIQIQNFLADSVMMQNVSVLVTVESGLFFAFCFAVLMVWYENKKHQIFRLVLQYYPGILVFLVLFYALTQVAFTCTGFNFLTIAILYALTVILSMVLAIVTIKKLVPEMDLRLEIHFIVSLIICILGLIITVDGKIVYKTSNETLNFRNIFLTVGLFLLFFLVGCIGNKIKWKLAQSRIFKTLIKKIK
ncbi:MAG: hypothetical protein J6581_08805 [Apibacter sp.]|nr:hypothetical protein [Apibacter sp.]